MAHRIIGYFKTKEEIINKLVWGKTGEEQYRGAMTYKLGDNNNGTKFAFIAFPISGSGSEREYHVYLVSDVTNTTDISNYSEYYIMVGSQTGVIGRETTGFSPANAYGYRNAPTGMFMSPLLDSNNMPIFIDENNVLNIYDGDYNAQAIDDFINTVMGKPAIPPKGQGTVTLDIPANGASLTFESALLGVSVTKMISKDAVVDMEDE